MSLEAASLYDPPNTDPAIPTVLFDIKLGRQLSYIDFDAEAYAAYLDRRGLSDEQIAATTVHFQAKQLNPFPVSDYIHTIGTCNVNVTPWRRASTLDKAVYQETEHHIDTVNDNASPVYLNVIANGGLLSGVSSILVGDGMLLLAAERIAPLEVLQGTGIALSCLGIACTAISRIVYSLNPGERRAHRAARRRSESFTTMTR